MQSIKIFKAAVLISVILITASAHALEQLPQPVFTQLDWMRLQGIPKMTVNKAIELSYRHACFFVEPFDALELHVEVKGQPKDVFIISDVGQDRLTLWQFTPPDDNGVRTLEKIAAYYGEEKDSLLAPSGLETNARNRLYT
jgi:hypothetical protein